MGHLKDCFRRLVTPKGGDVEEGSATVEYAIGAVTAAAFAGVLLDVVRSGGVSDIVRGMIETALTL